jgi:hypothetical protein
VLRVETAERLCRFLGGIGDLLPHREGRRPVVEAQEHESHGV